MAIAVLTIPCPVDGLPCFAIDMDWSKNTQSDRAAHVHIEVAGQAQCLNGHRWRIGDPRSDGGTVACMITLNRVGG